MRNKIKTQSFVILMKNDDTVRNFLNNLTVRACIRRRPFHNENLETKKKTGILIVISIS